MKPLNQLFNDKHFSNKYSIHSNGIHVFKLFSSPLKYSVLPQILCLQYSSFQLRTRQKQYSVSCMVYVRIIVKVKFQIPFLFFWQISTLEHTYNPCDDSFCPPHRSSDRFTKCSLIAGGSSDEQVFKYSIYSVVQRRRHTIYREHQNRIRLCDYTMLMRVLLAANANRNCISSHATCFV